MAFGVCGKPDRFWLLGQPAAASAHPPAWHTSALQASANGSKVSVQLGCRGLRSGLRAGRCGGSALTTRTRAGRGGTSRQRAQPGCGEEERERRGEAFPLFALLPSLMLVSCVSDGVLRGLTSLGGGGHLSRLRREPAGTAAMWFPCDLLRPLHRQPEASGPVLDREVGGPWWHLPGCPPPQPPTSLSRRVRRSKRELWATRRGTWVK